MRTWILALVAAALPFALYFPLMALARYQRLGNEPQRTQREEKPTRVGYSTDEGS